MAFIKKYTFLCSLLFMTTIYTLPHTQDSQSDIQNVKYCSQRMHSLAQQVLTIRKYVFRLMNTQQVRLEQARKKEYNHLKAHDRLLDAESTPFMKKVIEAHGWPKISQFGQDTCTDAFSLVLSSSDISFQEKCLSLMQKLPPNEIHQRTIAALYDRIQINRKKPQRYGTNADIKTGKLHPIETIDELRRSVDLEPLQDQITNSRNLKQELIKDKEIPLSSYWKSSRYRIIKKICFKITSYLVK